MYQDLACSPNTTYTATFLFTGLSDYNGTASSTFGLFVAAADPIGGGSRDSSPTFTVGMGTTPNLSMPAATLKSFTFTTGSETTERLCFFSTAASSVAPGNDYGPVVDDIRVTVAPEPCTIGMTVEPHRPVGLRLVATATVWGFVYFGTSVAHAKRDDLPVFPGTTQRSFGPLGAHITMKSPQNCTFALVWAAWLLGCGPISAADPIRVMPLGDSITAGLIIPTPGYIPGGYRTKLWHDLSDGRILD